MEYKTRYRDWIMKYFEEHSEQKVSAGDLHRQMTAEGMTINLTTIYRNLDRLERENILQGHKVGGEDEKFYQYLRPKMECARHLHLLCSRCGKIIHLNCGFMEEISAHLMEEHGFSLDCGQSILVGLCRECRQELAAQEPGENAGTADGKGAEPEKKACRAHGRHPEEIRMPECSTEENSIRSAEDGGKRGDEDGSNPVGRGY